jgi:hypothetical protein
MTDFGFESYHDIMRDVAIRQDIKDLILDAADRLLNQFGSAGSGIFIVFKIFALTQ